MVGLTRLLIIMKDKARPAGLSFTEAQEQIYAVYLMREDVLGAKYLISTKFGRK